MDNWFSTFQESRDGKKNQPAIDKPRRRSFTDEFKRDAVQRIIDGRSAASVAKNLDIGNTHGIVRAGKLADGAIEDRTLAELLALRRLVPSNVSSRWTIFFVLVVVLRASSTRTRT
ncbi:MAG: transposase [Pirellula sp.]